MLCFRGTPLLVFVNGSQKGETRTVVGVPKRHAQWTHRSLAPATRSQDGRDIQEALPQNLGRALGGFRIHVSGPLTQNLCTLDVSTFLRICLFRACVCLFHYLCLKQKDRSYAAESEHICFSVYPRCGPRSWFMTDPEVRAKHVDLPKFCRCLILFCVENDSPTELKEQPQPCIFCRFLCNMSTLTGSLLRLFITTIRKHATFDRP